MSELHSQVAELLCTTATSHGYAAQITYNGEVRVIGPAGETIYNLENLTRSLADVPRQDWPALVADHLSTGLGLDAVEDIAPLEEMDFAALRMLLRTRLYPGSTPELLGNAVRPLAPGLAQRLVLDGVHTISPVTNTLLDSWGTPKDDLFNLAEHNTRTDGPLDVERADFPPGAPPWFLLKGNDYASAHALWLDDYPDVIGRAGALFTVPAEPSIYAAPINGLEVVEAAEILASLAVHHFTSDPWPTSPHLYRWHRGHIELAVYTRPTYEAPDLHPTDSFLALLSQLAD